MQRKTLLIMGVISIIIFFILGSYVNNPIHIKPNLPNPIEFNTIQKIDYSIAQSVNTYRNSAMTAFMASITHLGDTGLASKVVIISIILVAIFFHRRFLVLLILGSGLVLVAIKITKIFFDRSRPGTLSGDGLPSMLITADGGSYPSGHATIATFLFIFFSWLIIHSIKNKPARIACISLVGLVAVFICISRVYLGVHFASDVIGGILLSVGLSSISLWIVRTYMPRLS